MPDAEARFEALMDKFRPSRRDTKRSMFRHFYIAGHDDGAAQEREACARLARRTPWKLPDAIRARGK